MRGRGRFLPHGCAFQASSVMRALVWPRSSEVSYSGSVTTQQQKEAAVLVLFQTSGCTARQ
eukprot:359151-Chlamydomonas_euryale.AAC.5